MSGRAKDGIAVGLSHHAWKMEANIHRAAPNALFPLIVPFLSVVRGLQAIVLNE